MSVGPSLEHLGVYYDFDPEVTARVTDAAERQHGVSFPTLAEQYAITDGPARFWDRQSDKYVEYLLLKNTNYSPDSPHSVLFAPMNTPIDENMAMRAIRLQAAYNERPLIAVGSPNARKQSFHLTPLEAMNVLEYPRIDPFTGTAAKLIRLISPEVEAIFGYSVGADMGAGVATQLAHDGIDVATSVLIESPATRRRTLLGLLADFKRSEPQLARYVEQSDSTALREARVLADQPFVVYAKGLLNLTNIALAKVMTDGDFASRVSVGLAVQHQMHAVIGWGTESELTTQADAEVTTNTVLTRYPDRAHAMKLRGMHHAGGDDINLHAAIMLQGVYQVATS